MRALLAMHAEKMCVTVSPPAEQVPNFSVLLLIDRQAFGTPGAGAEWGKFQMVHTKRSLAHAHFSTKCL
jgi:hypothetical protein